GEPTDPGDSGDADTSSDGDSGSDPDDTGVGAPAADGPDDLAVTGADVAGWAAAGALLILGGLVALSRRRASAKGITGQQV
ncbi:LPXTG cell wall anchor domain-containing protein, partial [Microbacterium sp.]|uniref:LPXTG cell wall anchor domain-containing protein n=2 Tax=unclassified Microbacterium TaxID=2609290 RepID=UPI003F949AD2